MKKTKLMLVVIAMLIVVLSGCGTSAPSTIGGSNESQPIESEDENGVPDFVQAMYDEMGELTEMYGLCYEMVKEPAYRQVDTAEHNWCYFEFETEEFGTPSPYKIQFYKDRDIQKKSFNISLMGDATKWYNREAIDAEWTEIIAAVATCVEPDGDFKEIKEQVRNIVTTQEDDKHSEVFKFGDYTMVVTNRSSINNYLYAVHDDEFWEEIKQEDYVPLNRENLLKTEANDRYGLLVQMEGTVEAFEVSRAGSGIISVRADDGFLYNIYFDMHYTPMTFKVGDRYRFFGRLDNSEELTQSIHYCEPIE